jgi:Na+-driven multidrug efflux pump
MDKGLATDRPSLLFGHSFLPRTGTSPAFVLAVGAPSMELAAQYLPSRALGMVPSLLSVTGSAAYHDMLNTVTSLKVSHMINAVNLVLDPC